MKIKGTLKILILIAPLVMTGCGQSKQEELATKLLQDREEAERKMAEGEKALTSKKGFNPF